MLESICDKSSTQKEAIAMDYPNQITDHEKGKHLAYEDYELPQLAGCCIKENQDL